MGKEEKIKEYYKAKYDPKHPDYFLLGWESKDAQYLRFRALTNSIDLNGKNILDVGCGTGDFFKYLKSRYLNLKYTGVDILETMIQIARKKDQEGNFLCADIFKQNPFKKNEFDAVFTSGIFNINLGNNKEFLIKAITLFDYISKDIISFNLLHQKSPNREGAYFYTTPEEVCSIINLNFSSKFKITVVENYLENDFTVVLKSTKSILHSSKNR